MKVSLMIFQRFCHCYIDSRFKSHVFERLFFFISYSITMMVFIFCLSEFAAAPPCRASTRLYEGGSSTEDPIETFLKGFCD